MSKITNAEVDWSEIEKKLEEVPGGNSTAHRGIYEFSNGERVFVKIGDNERTKAWSEREVKAYNFLEKNNFKYCPKLLAHSEDKTGFMIEALEAAKGWNWSDTWTTPRFNKTLLAMDTLAEISPEQSEKEWLCLTDGHNNSTNGWKKLFQNKEQQEYLLNTYDEKDLTDILNNLEEHVATSLKFTVKEDTLVHYDVRADNCAWNEELDEVKMVDWNWIQIGDRDLDNAAFLTHVHQNGINVCEEAPERLNQLALHWMAGFWLEVASKPAHMGVPKTLRPRQIRSALTALSLSRTCFQ